MNDDFISRRSWLSAAAASVVGGAALAAITSKLAGAESLPLQLTIYKDPSCDCCGKWAAHLTSSGLTPIVRDRKDMDAFKDSIGVPVALRSCHTAVYSPYWIEGHVPAADIKSLIATRPAGVQGIAVPGMPTGSPGMEAGSRKDKYDVIAVRGDGKTSVFASHG